MSITESLEGERDWEVADANEVNAAINEQDALGYLLPSQFRVEHTSPQLIQPYDNDNQGEQ